MSKLITSNLKDQVQASKKIKMYNKLLKHSDLERGALSSRQNGRTSGQTSLRMTPNISGFITNRTPIVSQKLTPKKKDELVKKQRHEKMYIAGGHNPRPQAKSRKPIKTQRQPIRSKVLGDFEKNIDIVCDLKIKPEKS